MDFNNIKYVWNEIKTICVLTTRWGAFHGGINVLNYEMCISIKEKYKEKIALVCVVEKIEPTDLNDATSNNIKLLECGENYTMNDVMAILKKEAISPEAWIGHDSLTGDIAIKCANENINSISAVLAHQDYQAYAASKGKRGPEVEKKHLEQKKIYLDANIVFAVGPKLQESVERITKKEPIPIYPGCFKTEVEPVEKIYDQFWVMTAGRLNKEDKNIKQGDTLIGAYVEYTSTLPGDNKLVLYGLDNADVENIANENLDKNQNIQGLPFSNNRNELFESLVDQTVFVMPSLHEGFGLTGLEAISLGVPLIVSYNSGLYKMLEKFELQHLVIPVEITPSQEKCKKNLVEALQKVETNKTNAKNSALELKQKMNETITWSNLAETIVNNLNQNREYKPYFPIKTNDDLSKFEQEFISINTHDKYNQIEKEIEKITSNNNAPLERYFGEILKSIVGIKKVNDFLETELTEKYDESRMIYYEDYHELEDISEYMKEIVRIISDIESENYLEVIEKDDSDIDGDSYEELYDSINSRISYYTIELKYLNQRVCHAESLIDQGTGETEDTIIIETLRDDQFALEEMLSSYNQLSENLEPLVEKEEKNSKVSANIDSLEKAYEAEKERIIIKEDSLVKILNTESESGSNSRIIYAKFCLSVNRLLF